MKKYIDFNLSDGTILHIPSSYCPRIYLESSSSLKLCIDQFDFIEKYELRKYRDDIPEVLRVWYKRYVEYSMKNNILKRFGVELRIKNG